MTPVWSAPGTWPWSTGVSTFRSGHTSNTATILLSDTFINGVPEWHLMAMGGTSMSRFPGHGSGGGYGRGEGDSAGHHAGMIHDMHTGEFPKGVGHRVENGWGLTKVAVVLLNGLLW